MGATADDEESHGKAPGVDRKLLEKVWTWLARHPDIHVGTCGQADKLSLSEVERRNSATASQSPSELIDPVLISQSPHRHSASNTPARSGRRSSSDAAEAELRLYADIERRWQAIAGHAPDKVKIPALDFACLSIVAAQRERGILQPDLVRISGQDKRSVPERTRRLQVGGYISKDAVLVNRSHTSRLILKKYSREAGQDGAALKAGGDALKAFRGAKSSVDSLIDFQAIYCKLFDILRETKLIAWNDLKARMVG